MLLLVVASFLPTQLNAQCTPDPNAPTFGVFPDTVPPACPGVPFDFTLTFAVPSDTTIPGFPLTLNIDSVRLDDLLDLPPGLTYSCNPTTCAIPGGTAGCVRITGTPTTAGTFGVDIAATAFISGLVFPDTLVDTLIVVVGFDATADVVDASCGGSDGTATFAVNGGTAPYTFLWSDGQTDSIATNLAPGTYTATITDADGCSLDFNTNVATTGAGPDINVANSTTGWTGCAEDMGGFVQVDFTGGTAPYTYAWTGGSADQNLLNVAAGTYTISITDDNGCVDNATFEVAAPDTLQINLANQTDASCFGEADGTAEVTVEGGQGAYTYSWNTSPVQTAATASGLPSGTFTVTVEDNALCSKTFEVMVGEPDSLAGNLGSLGESEAGSADGKAWAEPSGGTAPYTYEWENSTTGDSLLNVTQGTYSVVITDANGCELTDSVEVGVITSIAELPNGIQALDVYPNPSQGSVTVAVQLTTAEAVSIQVRDIQGRVVRSNAFAATTQLTERIELGNLPMGVYVVAITAGEQTVHQRLMLQR